MWLAQDRYRDIFYESFLIMSLSCSKEISYQVDRMMIQWV